MKLQAAQSRKRSLQPVHGPSARQLPSRCAFTVSTCELCSYQHLCASYAAGSLEDCPSVKVPEHASRQACK